MYLLPTTGYARPSSSWLWTFVATSPSMWHPNSEYLDLLHCYVWGASLKGILTNSHMLLKTAIVEALSSIGTHHLIWVYSHCGSLVHSVIETEDGFIDHSWETTLKEAIFNIRTKNLVWNVVTIPEVIHMSSNALCPVCVCVWWYTF